MGVDQKINSEEFVLEKSNIKSLLRKYRKLKVSCPDCGMEGALYVPVNFKSSVCDNCHTSLDLSFWYDDGLVDHLLMRKLITTCYKHVEFFVINMSNFQKR